MNAEGCPPLYRSDTFMLYGPPNIGSCDVPIIAYAVLAGLLISGRLFFTVTSWQQWLVLKRKGYTKRRLPVNPTLNVFMLICQSLLFILGGFDVIHAQNGTSGVIFSLWTLFYFALSLVLLRKLVSLGTKLVYIKPKGNRSSKEVERSKTGEALNATSLIEQEVRKLDIFLKAVIVVIFVGGILQFIFLVILGAIVYPGALFTIRGAFGSNGSIIFVIVGGVTWQFERCIRAIKHSTYYDINSEASTPIRIAIRKMRLQQAGLAIGAIPAALIHILHAANVVPITWIWVIVECSLDVLIFASFALSNRFKRECRRLPGSSGASDSAKQTAKDTHLAPTGGGSMMSNSAIVASQSTS